MSPNEENIINLSYAYFATIPVTPETIREFIQRSRGFYPEDVIDEKDLFNKIESIHSVTIDGDANILDDSADHEEWFNPTTNLPLKREFKWHFWDHYRQYLMHGKHRTSTMVDALDRFSGLVLSRMEDPLRAGHWDRRGMVVGNVQSGKTENYTALVTKAADAGYKLFIILAGVHNSLRSQTQERLNEEVMGYDLDVVQKFTGQERRIGVRKMFHDHGIVNTLTSNAQYGDFKTAIANNAGIIPSPTGDPIILVVKKNVTILKNLLSWATTLGYTTSSGAKIMKEIPFLLIDDECDFASVNTRKPEKDEDGNIVQDWDPAKTNMYIRRLLSSFEKSVYIGYTATPYANIFIHKDEPHPRYGEDLFPKHFLISLPQPSNYLGPEEVFGLKGDSDKGIAPARALPLAEQVNDTEDIIPSSHKSSLEVDSLPGSMIEAIKAFIMVCAARRVRGTGVPHNSMLIHVTRFTRVQNRIKQLVESELRTLIGRIMSGTDELSDFRGIWESKFVPTSLEMTNRGFRDVEVNDWESIYKELYPAVRVIRVKGINGEIGDILDYRTAEKQTSERLERRDVVPWTERGVSIIAIGGDKLSRGLTLEGLSISYYLRAARMYDTLMQMGRWFGYHTGYADLCKIYTTEELKQWYSHIALANKELRNDFEYMEAIGSTPETFGLKVRSHPGRLAITSAGKSRATEKMLITFGGSLVQTIVFDPRFSSYNRKILEQMLDEIGRPPDVKHERLERFHWRNVPPDIVIKFLQSYKIHQDAMSTSDPSKWAEYISKQVKKKELRQWDVVLVSNPESEGTHEVTLGRLKVRCVHRSANQPVTGQKITIGVLTNPSDEMLDLNDEERASAWSHSKKPIQEGKLPSGAAIRNARPSERGLLLIYLPESHDSTDSYGLSGNEIVGFAISFPGSDTAEPVEYLVNSIYAEKESSYDNSNGKYD